MSKPVRVNPISEFAPRDQSTCGPNQYNYCYYNQNTYPKDPDRLNCYLEKDGDHIRVFKRPGKAVVWSLDTHAVTGQGMTMFNGVPFAVVYDTVAASECLVFPAGPPNSGTDGTAWTSSSVGPWAIRDYPVCVIFNNQIVLIGGQPAGVNDVWATSDGITWNQLGVVPFGFRYGYNGCVFNGAIYLFGGLLGGVYQNDVWMSTDGVNWTQIALTSPWTGRQLMGVISTSAGMYILGGVGNAGQFNDVWFSTGWAAVGTAAATIGWQQQTSAAGWSIRSNMMCWNFNNTLFVGGGVNVVTSQNDVWSSTNGGSSWTQLTAAAFATGIDSGSALVYNNKLWMLGGSNGGARSSTIYSSPTGVTWTNIGSIPGGAKEGMGAVVFQVPSSVSTGRYQTMWLMGGDTGTFQNTTYRANLNTTLTNTYPLTPQSFTIAGQPYYRYDFAAFSNNTQLLIKSNSALFVADQGGVQRVQDNSYPPVTVPGLVVLGDSAYVMDPTGLIFGSPNSNPYVWPAVNRIPADYESDPGVAIAKYMSYLVAFGTYTTQFFYDAGTSPGSALLPYLAASLKIGCYSASTVQTFDNTVIWMSQNKEGYRQIMMFNGLQAVPISNTGIEKMITGGGPTVFLSDVIMYANHSFYLLTITNSTTSPFIATTANTIVYDLTSKEWVRWENCISDPDGFGFMMGGSSTNLSYAGQNSYFLSPFGGNVYSLGSLYADNAGNYMFALQSSKFDAGNNANKFWGPFELIGDKLSGSVNVQYTDDDYTTWSAVRPVDMNTPRPILYMNGQGRRRAVTLTQLDANPRVIEYMEYPSVEQGE